MKTPQTENHKEFCCKKCWIDNGNGRGFCQFPHCECHIPQSEKGSGGSLYHGSYNQPAIIQSVAVPQHSQEQWREEFREKFRCVTKIVIVKDGHRIVETQSEIESFISTLLQQARQEEREAAIKLSDDIEVRFDVSSTEEWRAFKAFRNALRDKSRTTSPLQGNEKEV
jgi:hypothetical protein